MPYSSDLLDRLFQAPTTQETQKATLRNSHILAEELGFPHRAFSSIHVAGTNGKGSVSLKIATALQNSGYRVGLYTSPHLFHFSERIKVNAEPIDEESLNRGLQLLFSIDEKLKLNATFFELATQLAFYYFRNKEVDIAVIETGLGGRLDATNIIDPILTVITSISLEHTQMLGNDLEMIAMEKAGILKPAIPCVLGPKAHCQAIRERARALDCPLIMAEEAGPFFDDENRAIAKAALMALPSSIYHTRPQTWNLDRVKAPGSNDRKGPCISNTKALTIVESRELSRWSKSKFEAECGINLSQASIEAGLNVRPPCRFEQRDNVIFDVAHNPDAFAHLVQALNLFFPGKKKRFLLGFCKDKDAPSCLRHVTPIATHIHLVQAQSSRAASLDSLAQSLKEQGFYAFSSHPHISEGMDEALLQADLAGELLIVCGSFYIIEKSLARVSQDSFLLR